MSAAEASTGSTAPGGISPAPACTCSWGSGSSSRSCSGGGGAVLDARLRRPDLAGRNAAAGAVAAHFDEGLTADLEALQRLASALSAGFGDADLSQERRLVRAAHETFRHRETIFLLDRELNVLAIEPSGTLAEVLEAARPLVEEVLATGRPRMSELVLEPRGAVVHELVPLRSWTGEVVGVVGGTFQPERRDFGRMLEHLRRGRTGFADLVDASGHVLAERARARGSVRGVRRRDPQLAVERRTKSVSCRELPVDQRVGDRQLRGLTANELLTFAPLGSAPWAVVVRQSSGEALPTQGGLPGTWSAVGSRCSSRSSGPSPGAPRRA